MPWTVDDVDSHRKGLTPSQKKKWVEIANSARSSCIDDGGSEKDCDAMAIKAANSHFATNEGSSGIHLLQTNYCNLVRNETLNGKNHMVAPFIGIFEGVGNGILYPGDSLQESAPFWNDAPVPVDHPMVNGKPVTCRDPQFMNSVVCGRVYNTKFEDGKLKGELWVDEERLNSIDPSISTRIKANQVMEVSTGMFMDLEEGEGEFQGRKYSAIASNIRPDHIAILPRSVGAFSVGDGAGFPRINQDQDTGVMHKVFRALKSIGLIHDNEMSHSDIQEVLAAGIRGKVGKEEFIYITDVFDGSVIYERSAESLAVGQLFRRSYSVSPSDGILVGDDEIEVRRETRYVPVLSPTTNQSQEEEEASPEVSKPKGEDRMKEEIVNSLISAPETPYAEGDRESLMTLNEDLLKKMDAAAPKAPEAPAPQTPSINVEEILAKVTEAATAAIQSHINSQPLNQLRQAILTNEDCPFTMEDLMKMDEARLKAVQRSFRTNSDFGGRGFPPEGESAKVPEMPKTLLAPPPNKAD
jgi:hypothetical protein